MKKVLASAAIASSLVAAGAAPASATFDTGAVTSSILMSSGHIIGVCMQWGTVPVVTVTNPLQPSTNLVVVSVPVLYSIGIC